MHSIKQTFILSLSRLRNTHTSSSSYYNHYSQASLGDNDDTTATPFLLVLHILWQFVRIQHAWNLALHLMLVRLLLSQGRFTLLQIQI